MRLLEYKIGRRCQHHWTAGQVSVLILKASSYCRCNCWLLEEWRQAVDIRFKAGQKAMNCTLNALVSEFCMISHVSQTDATDTNPKPDTDPRKPQLSAYHFLASFCHLYDVWRCHTHREVQCILDISLHSDGLIQINGKEMPMQIWPLLFVEDITIHCTDGWTWPETLWYTWEGQRERCVYLA